MHPKTNAIIRSIQDPELKGEELGQVLSAVWMACEFRQQHLHTEANRISGLIVGIPEKNRKQFVQALLFNRLDASDSEEKVFTDFQSIKFSDAYKLIWDPDLQALSIDDVPMHIPQSLKAIDGILETRCQNLSLDQINLVRTYIQKNIGPWNFCGMVSDFTSSGERIWAVDKTNHRLAPIFSGITVADFLERYGEQIKNLTPLGQQTIAYHLSKDIPLLHDSTSKLELIQSKEDPNVVIVTGLGISGVESFLLSRHQTSEEFLELFPAEGFEFTVKQEGILRELKDHITGNIGYWNNIGIVRKFFVDELGGVKTQLVDGSIDKIDLKWPFGQFMKTFVDDNPNLDLAGKRMIEQFIDDGKLKPKRGDVKTVYGSKEVGYYIMSHSGKFIFAGFSRLEDPKSFISSMPLLSPQSKKVILAEIEKNPDLPEWNSQGYIKDFKEENDGVILIRYDDKKRFLPFDTSSESRH